MQFIGIYFTFIYLQVVREDLQLFRSAHIQAITSDKHITLVVTEFKAAICPVCHRTCRKKHIICVDKPKSVNTYTIGISNNNTCFVACNLQISVKCACIAAGNLV